MRLHDIKPNPGAKHSRKRLGRGESSGLGKTSGRGNKGQKSRAGKGIRIGFEGGQMPLYRRLPRRGFNNANFKISYAVLNVSDLETKFEAGAEINEEAIRAAGLMKGHQWAGAKILGDGEITKSFTVTGVKVSATAKTKIEAAGGTITE